MSLHNEDYIDILKYYNLPIPKSKRLLQIEAEKILSSKLCKCIKKVNLTSNSDNEPRAIGICTKTIFNKKGLTRGKFKCTNKRYVKFNKTKKLRKIK
jgi:hypothetical protein